jgi:ABC-type multidrug transport system ATPase subunit
MPAAVETHSLTKHYRRTVALDRVTLEIPEGAVYALVGANGAGKTTLKHASRY